MREDGKTRRPAEFGEPISRRTPEERKLPRGYVAVISEINPALSQGYARAKADFIVQIGRVLPKSPDALSQKEKKSGVWVAANHISIPEGEHAGDMLVLPISDGPSSGEKYAINVWNMPDDKEVKLELYTISSKPEFIRSGEVNASVLKDHGFDLDPKNPNNLGKQLDSYLAQAVFYDFLVGQGDFGPQERLTTRRTLATKRSKDTVCPYVIPAIVETDRENEYTNLMRNYFIIASALRPQNEIRKLEEYKTEQTTIYRGANAGIRRDMEAGLKIDVHLLLETGFERALNIVGRLMIDDEQPEDEVYRLKEKHRITFASTKSDRKIDMLLQLVALKQKMAIINLERYLEICHSTFPVGPKAKVWDTRVKNALSQVGQAEVS